MSEKIIDIINGYGDKIKFENEDSKAECIKKLNDFATALKNDNIKDAESKFNVEREEYRKQVADLNTAAANSKKAIDELTANYKKSVEDSSKKDSEKANLESQINIYKQVGIIDDEELHQLNLLVKDKMSADKDAKFEDVVKDIAQKRGFGKKAGDIPAQNQSGAGAVGQTADRPQTQEEQTKAFLDAMRL